MYRIPIKPISARLPSAKVSNMAPKGINKSIFSQFLTTDSAISIENYIPSDEGYLVARKGIVEEKDFGLSSALSKVAHYHDDVFVVASGQSMIAYDKSTGVTTTIKGDFISSSYGLARYGGYMFITSKSNGLWRVQREATYSERQISGDNSFIISGSGSLNSGNTVTDSVSGATGTVVTWESAERRARITVVSGTFGGGHAITGGSLSGASITSINALHNGKIITGATSGATAVVVSSSSGVLVLKNIRGTFQSGEEISDNYATDSSFTRGRGTITSTVDYEIYEVTAAPFAGVIAAIESRLYLGDLEDDSAAVAYSSADLNTGTPFTNWTEGASSSSAGRLNFQKGGAVKKILPQGRLIVVLQESGEFAFYHDTLESGSSYYKIDRTQDYREGWGSSPAAVATDSGIFYANEAGLFQLTSVGQTNVPFSQQEANLTWKALGARYFDNVNLDNADMVWNPIDRTVMLTCGLNSTTNNHIIVYNTDTKAFYFFTGLSIGGFMYHNGALYGYDASEPVLYKMLEGYDDDGSDISRSYIQEIQLGDLQGLSTIVGLEVQALLSTTSELHFYLDVYDSDGVFRRGASHFICAPNINGGAGGAGYGGSEYGASGYSSGEQSGLINWIDQCAPFVRNAQRAILRIESTGSDAQSISYVRIDSVQTGRVRKRTMTRQTV